VINKDFNQNRVQITEQLFRLFDLLSILLSLLLSMWIYGVQFSQQYFIAVTMAMLCYLLISSVTNIYRLQPGYDINHHSGLVIFSSFLTFMILLFAASMTKTSADYSRVTITLWFFLMSLFLIAWRFVFRKMHLNWLKNKRNLKRVAIIGANDIGNQIAASIKENISFGYQLIGFFDDRRESDDRTVKNPVISIIGTFDDAARYARNKEIDVLYISLPMSAEQRIITLLDKLSDSAIAVHIIPNFFIYNILHARWHNIGPHQALSIYDTPFYGAGSLLKKIEDISIASFILLLVSIPMLLIALAIKLTSPGPVIFKQKRYGINGKELIIYKFRSMTTCDDGRVVKQAEKNDARITPLGAFLRRTSMDELPQFVNVLQGTMSVVGPRPHAVAHNEEYRRQIGGYMLRHLVKPGITGWAQINGFRGETKALHLMKQRIKYDLDYIRNWSLIWDIKIISQTIFKGFINKNAY